ncbi:MAG: TolC family protein [Methyloceanibacter sp.]|nr:TolC family protein [Methyloceanibacter sp.]
MRCLVALIFALGTIAISAGQTQARDNSTYPLYLHEVLSSSARYYPEILESFAKRRAAAGAALEAEGAFDLVFESDGFDRASGFWDGRYVSTGVRQNLRPLGAQVYGGYRVSGGEFPIYENEYFTNTGGELKIGVLFSLLRDRAIDKRRFGAEDARLALEQADLEVLLTQVGVQTRAYIAYFRWVWAGAKLSVYEDLERIAIERQEALEEKVRSGARAQLDLTENRLNIVRRQRLSTEARRDLLTAANTLSLYYRDATGRPITPDITRVPPIGTLVQRQDLGIVMGRQVPEILMRRPELQILRTRLKRARQLVELSYNDLKPRLDLTSELSGDLGSVGAGGPSFNSTDTVLGLRFSVPLQQRTAWGRIDKAEAEVDALDQRRRQTEDQIEIDLRNIILDLNAAQKLLRITAEELNQSEAMQKAEQLRFSEGAGEFFLVILREETAAEARIQYYLAGLQSRIAQANYDGATLNLSRLGLR